MTRPFDVSKFRKSITKAVPGMAVGFSDTVDWISTGNYALNFLISGDFQKGVPLGRVTCLAGESGSGKSYIASGNLVRHAQQQGILPIILDSENALDSDWLSALGVDISEDKLMRFGVSMVDEVAKFISEFMKGYKEQFADAPYEERQKILFVVDSLGMLLTPTDKDQFEKGDMKGDMGRKPKALTSLVRNSVNLIAGNPVGIVACNHTYASQDMFDPDDKISGGQGFIYASSIVVAMKKLKLKEDEAGNKITDIRGIRAACKVMKTRFAKPFESVQIKIPYDTGMNPYSGLLDLFEKAGAVIKDGNKLSYSKPGKEPIKEFRKNWTDEKLEIIMKDFSSWTDKNEPEELNNSVSTKKEDTNENDGRGNSSDT